MSRDFNRALAAHGLAFPVGHCPGVKLSGFILNGGLGLNSNAWGTACLNVESVRVVTADAQALTVDGQHHNDLFWAIRGGGPGFFGVITQYQLKLHPMPRAITTTSLFFPLAMSGEIGAWAGDAVRRLPQQVEFSVAHVAAPPPLVEACKPDRGYACLVNASAFVDSEREAAAALAPVNDCPLAGRALLKEMNQPTPIDALLDTGAIIWPELHRCLSDTIWTNSPPAEVLATLTDRFRRAPSSKALAPLVFSSAGRAPLPDLAFSMTADALLLCYAIWERADDDAANAAWHRETIAALDRFAVGHFVGESDIVGDPRRAERSYSPAAWRRLQALRRQYDPDNLFYGHFAVRGR